MVTRREHEDNLTPDSRIFLLLSRMLVSLVAVLLIAIPWSERYSLLDNFPRGQDTEFSILAFLVFLGLMLLLARSRKSFLGALMVWCEAYCQYFRSNSPLLHAVETRLPGLTSHQQPPGVALATNNLPLQI